MPQEFDLNHLLEIMDSCREYRPGHPLGRPYMSAYQIAIRFARDHPEHPVVQELRVGGEGTGERRSLAQQIAGFLSREAQTPGSQVDGAFISHQDIVEFTFDNNGSPLRVSGLIGPGHSIFRRRPAS